MPGKWERAGRATQPPALPDALPAFPRRLTLPRVRRSCVERAPVRRRQFELPRVSGRIPGSRPFGGMVRLVRNVCHRADGDRVGEVEPAPGVLRRRVGSLRRRRPFRYRVSIGWGGLPCARRGGADWRSAPLVTASFEPPPGRATSRQRGKWRGRGMRRVRQGRARMRHFQGRVSCPAADGSWGVRNPWCMHRQKVVRGVGRPARVATGGTAGRAVPGRLQIGVAL